MSDKSHRFRPEDLECFFRKVKDPEFSGEISPGETKETDFITDIITPEDMEQFFKSFNSKLKVENKKEPAETKDIFSTNDETEACDKSSSSAEHLRLTSENLDSFFKKVNKFSIKDSSNSLDDVDRVMNQFCKALTI
jgi:hypothetical protein